MKALDLGGNMIGDDGVISLADVLHTNQSLKILELWENNIAERGVMGIARMLQNNKRLDTIDLRKNTVSDTAAKALAEAIASNSYTKLHRVIGVDLSPYVEVMGVPPSVVPQRDEKADERRAHRHNSIDNKAILEHLRHKPKSKLENAVSVAAPQISAEA
eukprot:CAMPEP_0182423934 /NCGR_PEP_ID=MMETSP1167-20130531/10039_1 /TAXON_ID=2988 /ORGANISM="Mallomonas Sp, Strain CCMP3275" /LENGTH=159 /DNA_ID=CAMNT_0024603321 /DNA_START=203 /DNA_END=682 /DNA_ORIENTATION=+